MTAVEAYTRGVCAACTRFKVAGPMGSDAGVQPKGPEWSHGTASNEYALRGPQHKPDAEDGTSSAEANMTDWLWDNFTSYDDNMAPGRADGSYGQEVIG
jgi:hypothetical protein